MWIPLVLVGSILYWSVALGLGRMSLSLLGDTNDEELVNCPGSNSIRSVTLPGGKRVDGVRLVNEKELAGFGGNHALDDGTGHLPAIDDSPVPLLDDTLCVGQQVSSRADSLCAPPAPTLDDPPGRTSY
jgi:hypothetical protein